MLKQKLKVILVQTIMYSILLEKNWSVSVNTAQLACTYMYVYSFLGVYQASSFGIVVGLIVSVMIAVVIILKNRKKSNLEVSTRARYHRGSTNDTRL